ncbi:ROK family protein [Hymenobacter sp. BT507]|uniref:ROK family protein n=1 Tax=Hymenobacter citatus TaxID=2763506 RepID=A0ABR7MNG2_9BACT|nr:ROK family protein [Hymenobacter citatus]MBC6612624.1 ROK family protein [Hymenobacter citatus]
MTQTNYIGIDIGGTKVHIGVVQDGQIVRDVRFETSAQAPQEQILGELVRHIQLMLDTADVAGIGIGVPGLVDEQQGVVHNVQNIPSWREVRLKEHLARHFAQPVYMTNDANAFAVGEKIFGQGQPYANLVGLTLGTGLGAGIIINHDLHAGTLSSAGEFGCIPYLDKTVEDYCSGKFFVQQYQQEGGALYALARTGDARALEALASYGRHLGNTIKIILHTLAPEAIFLGGSVSHGYELFREAMEASIREFPFRLVTDRLVVAPSKLRNAAVLGAAALCKMKQELSTATPQTLPL